jgi:hypothetical protein
MGKGIDYRARSLEAQARKISQMSTPVYYPIDKCLQLVYNYYN